MSDFDISLALIGADKSEATTGLLAAHLDWESAMTDPAISKEARDAIATNGAAEAMKMGKREATERLVQMTDDPDTVWLNCIERVIFSRNRSALYEALSWKRLRSFSGNPRYSRTVGYLASFAPELILMPKAAVAGVE